MPVIAVFSARKCHREVVVARGGTRTASAGTSRRGGHHPPRPCRRHRHGIRVAWTSRPTGTGAATPGEPLQLVG